MIKISDINEVIRETMERHMHEGLWEFHSQTSPEKFIEDVSLDIMNRVMRGK